MDIDGASANNLQEIVVDVPTQPPPLTSDSKGPVIAMDVDSASADNLQEPAVTIDNDGTFADNLLAPIHVPNLPPIVFAPPYTGPVDVPARTPPSVATGNKAPVVEMDIDVPSADDLQAPVHVPNLHPLVFAPDPVEVPARLPPSVAPDTKLPFVAQDHQVPVAPVSAHKQQIKKPLVLNGFNIEIESAYRASQLASPARHYYILEKTQSYIQYTEAKLEIPTLDLIRSNRGGNNSGTMVHILIALDLASWLSNDVKLQFHIWTAELLLTNQVEIGKEKTLEELGDILKHRIAEEQVTDHNAFLREKYSRELLAIDEDIISKRAKRQRDDEEEIKDRAAKRQRDDDAAKEKLRMKSVQFNEEKEERKEMLAKFKKMEEVFLLPYVAHAKTLCGIAMLTSTN